MSRVHLGVVGPIGDAPEAGRATRTTALGREVAWGPPPPAPAPAWERELARDAGAIAAARVGLLRFHLARAGVDAYRDAGVAAEIEITRWTLLRDPLLDRADVALASAWRRLRRRRLRRRRPRDVA